MAKVILVSLQINATSWQLAKALRAQQHEVTLLTSYGEQPPDSDPHIQIMGYFRRWSALEGLRIIPGLFGLEPQILHLLLEEDKMNAAQVVLSGFAKAHPSCVLTTSLLNIRRGLNRRNLVRYLIEESDIVTCPTVENLGHLRGLNVRSRGQGRGILPPVLNLDESGSSFEMHSESAIENPSQSDFPEHFIVLPFRQPGFRPDHIWFKTVLVLAKKYHVVLWGTYAHWPLRDRKKFAQWMESHGLAKAWTVTGDLSPSEGNHLLEKSSALGLTGLKLTPIELTEYMFRAFKSETTLILDSRQTQVHADLWKNSVNCWILSEEKPLADLQHLLNVSSLKLPVDQTLKSSQGTHVMDSAMNELNRLYNRALVHIR